MEFVWVWNRRKWKRLSFYTYCCLFLQKKERECMQLHIGILRSELERQRKALTREMDLMQKESAQLVKKGNQIHQTTQLICPTLVKKTSPYVSFFLYTVTH